MKTFLRAAPFLLLLLLLVSVSINIWLSRKQSGHSKEIQNYEQSIRDKEVLTLQLTEERQILQDSVNVLNAKIAELDAELSEKVEVIQENRKRMKRLERQRDKLLKQMNQLRTAKSTDTEKIKALENAQFVLDQQIGELFMQNDSLENVNNQLLEQVVEREQQKENLIDRINTGRETNSNNTGADIIDTLEKSVTERYPSAVELDVNKINVNYTEITPRTKKGRKSKTIRKWYFTAIKFNLTYDNSDPTRALNQNFILQIIDADNKKPLPPLEGNSSHDAKGESFSFTQNPVGVNFINYEKKAGTRYIIQLSFIDKTGKYQPIPSSVRQIQFERQ